MALQNPGMPILFALMACIFPSAQESRSIEIRNEVEGRPQILFLIKEGSKVKKGDLVCELDSAGLKDSLTEQEIRTKQAEAESDIAQKSLQVVEQGQAEVRSTVDEDIASTENKIKILQIEIQLCNNTIANEARLEKSVEGLAELARARADLVRHKAELVLTQTRLKTLKTVTKPQRELEIEITARKARSDASTKAAILKIEREREAKLRTMIRKCKIVSTAAGMVQYANPAEPRPNTIWIEEGALIRERQVILRILTD